MSKYKSLMVKSNYIIEASYKLSLQEQRIIYILLSKIKKDDEEFKVYKFSVKEIANTIKTNHKGMHSEVSKNIDNLRNKNLTIIKDNSILRIKWLSSAQYFVGQGTVELEFSPKLKPYLLQLKEQFTKLYLDRVINFNSYYSCRVYELLKQYQSIGKRILLVDDIRTMFCIETNQYSRYNDFKRKIIIQAQKEINSKSDIYFDFEEIKTGHKVTALKFYIKSNSKDELS